jgi:hypothetical protein
MDALSLLPRQEETFFTLIGSICSQVFAEDEDFIVGQWRKSLEEDRKDDDRMEIDFDILEIDKNIGSRFLDDDLFGGASCDSPIGPVEELAHAMEFDEDDCHLCRAQFHLDTVDENMEVDTTGMSFEDRYKATLKKLATSMKRSQETRSCLTMKTTKTENYDRFASVEKILSSIAESSSQVQNYVTSIKQQA